MAMPLGLRSNSASAQTTVCSLGIGNVDLTLAALSSVSESGDSWNESSNSCARVPSIVLKASCTLGAYSAFSASSLSAAFSSRTAFALLAAPATAAPAVVAAFTIAAPAVVAASEASSAILLAASPAVVVASTIAAPAATATPDAPSAILVAASPAVLEAFWISFSGSKPLSNMAMDEPFS